MFEVKTLTSPVKRVITLPASKSIANRALICAALAEGESVLRNVNLCTDVQVMIDALRDLGFNLELNKDTLKISGGLQNMQGANLDKLQNAGTATRFLTALACLVPGETSLDDTQMRKRPMRPLVQALRELGAEISGEELPLKIRGSSMRGGKVRLPASQSSQFVSALLLISPYFEEGLEVELTGKSVSSDYIELTLQVMRAFGVEVIKLPYGFKVLPQKYQATEYESEADLSAATYFKAINFLSGSKITFSNLPASSLQPDRHFPALLAELKAGRKEFDLSATPDLVPTLAVCAATLPSEIKFQNIGNLRHKESDRIHSLTMELARVGAKVQEFEDALIIQGGDLHGAEIETYSDHRIAMSFAALGTKVAGMKIKDPECVNKSYPEFWEEMEKVIRG